MRLVSPPVRKLWISRRRRFALFSQSQAANRLPLPSFRVLPARLRLVYGELQKIPLPRRAALLRSAALRRACTFCRIFRPLFACDMSLLRAFLQKRFSTGHTDAGLFSGPFLR